MKNYQDQDGCHNCKYVEDGQGDCTTCSLICIKDALPKPTSGEIDTLRIKFRMNDVCAPRLSDEQDAGWHKAWNKHIQEQNEWYTVHSVEPWGKCKDYERGDEREGGIQC